MKTYTILRAAGAPDWDAVPALRAETFLWLPPADIGMTAQLCYDPEGLHVRLRAREAEIRAVHDAPLSPVWEDSCLEFFFCPVEGDGRYFNFEINPNGRTYIGIGLRMDDRVRLVPQQEDKLLSKRVARLPGGWEASYTIPLSLIRVFFPGYTLEPGRVLRANCYKCGDLTVQPHFLAWNPIDSPTPDFHRSDGFGRMVLG